MRLLWCLVAAAVLSACAKSLTAPSGVQVGGAWTGLSTLISASNSECVGALYQARIGRTDVMNASISQSGSTLSATITAQNAAVSCSYTGTATSTGTFVLDVSTCQAATITGLRCANGTVRDLDLMAGELNASVSGNRATGTNAETWSIFETGTSNPAGSLTLNSTVNLVR